MRSDPGVGSWDAEVGSTEWAKRFRLGWLATKHDLRDAPERFVRYYRKAVETRAWTVMNGPNGGTFHTFDEFCRAPEPWGFGEPWTNIRPFLVGVVPERELDLATVAPAKVPDPPAKGKPNRGPAAKRQPDPDTVSDSGSGSNGEARAAERLRAIAERAPEPVRELYKQGLLGQKEASKLGPKNPKPEDAARVTAIAQELASEAKALDASTESLRKQAQRALNLKARQLLGVQSDRVTDLLRAIERLADDDRARLVATMKERGWA